MQKQLTVSLPTFIIGGLLVAAIVVIAVLVTVLIERGGNGSPDASVAVTTATAQPSVVSATAVTSTVPPTATLSVPPPEAPVAAAAYDDPFAYCSAVGTIDSPDNRYTGPQYPQSVLDGLASAMRKPLISSVVPWRCVSGQVWGCFVGANLPCGRIDTSNEPTDQMNNYCRDNPGTALIPAAITGHGTLYGWTCRGGVAVAGTVGITLDPRGFASDWWYHLRSQ